MKINRCVFCWLAGLALFGCAGNGTASKFKCGVLISESEVDKLAKNSFKNYLPQDLDLLGNFTGLVNEVNGKTSEYKVFFNAKADNLLVLDIYGIVADSSIEHTACSIFSQGDAARSREIKLLFHKYPKGGGGETVGLKNK
ncbi:MAG: hypothetical protein HY842_17715 [Bacteroidetes bacterium]|nr:hypothetical protein [Bacteroidota bacterium]